MPVVSVLKNLSVTARLNKFYKPRKIQLTDIQISVAVEWPAEVINEIDKYNVVLAEFHDNVTEFFESAANFDDFIKDWTYSDGEAWTESSYKREPRAAGIQKRFETKITAHYQKKWEDEISGLMNKTWKESKAVGAKFKAFKQKCYLTVACTVAGMVVATAGAIITAPTGIGIATTALGYAQGVGICYTVYKKLATSLQDQVKICDTRYKALESGFKDAVKDINSAVAAVKKAKGAVKAKNQFKETLKVAGSALTGGAADYIIDAYNGSNAKSVSGAIKGFDDALDTLEAKLDNFADTIKEMSGSITELLDAQEKMEADMEKLRKALTQDILDSEKINVGASKDWSMKRKQLGVLGQDLTKNQAALARALKAITTDSDEIKTLKKSLAAWRKQSDKWHDTFDTKKLGLVVQFLIDTGVPLSGNSFNPADWAGIGSQVMGSLNNFSASYGVYNDAKDLYASIGSATPA